LIENISGFTEDDTVALTGLQGKMEMMYRVEGLATDICNVIIRNVNSAAYCSNVRLLSGSGVKLHDILVDGVFDAVQDSPWLDSSRINVRIGDKHPYGSPAQPGEVYNIAVKNVHGKCPDTVLVECIVNNLQLENICCDM